MEAEQSEELTRILEAFRSGDVDAEKRLAALLWNELGERAARLMRQERRRRPDHSLETFALFNETWLRLKTSDALAQMLDGMGLTQAATNIMKQVLVDHARTRKAKKRGGGRRRVPLDAVLDRFEGRDLEMVALNEALEELARTRSELVSQVVWLRFVEDYEVKEVAAKLNITVYMVEKASSIGRAFLRGRLFGEKQDS
jgi:RNA polymerase sigma factor (TIGR02999 family)